MLKHKTREKFYSSIGLFDTSKLAEFYSKTKRHFTKTKEFSFLYFYTWSCVYCMTDQSLTWGKKL